MAIISTKEVSKGTIEYYCNLWGKVFQVHYVSEVNWLIIINSLKYECPKCDIPYDEPNHGDQIKCSKCFAEFEFYGALYPRPIGKTRKEVEEALEWR